MSEVSTPIVVNQSSLPAALQTALGQIIPAVGGLIVSAGWMTGTQWATAAGLLPIIAGAAWRIWVAYHSHEEKKTLAAAAPNSVGQVR